MSQSDWSLARWVVVCIALTAPGCAEGPSSEQLKSFAEAESAFNAAKSAEDYLRVAGTYEQLREDGVRSAAVLFNQGNAFARAEQHGRAIACYRQALRLQPSNESIRANLMTALSATGAVEPPVGWFRRIVFWHDWLNYQSKFYFASALLVFTSVMLLAAKKARSGLAARVAVGVLMLASIAVMSAAYDWYRFEKVRSGAIAIAGVTPRRGNGSSYEPAFTQPLPEGTEFDVSERRGDWFHITVRRIGSGWVKADEVVIYH